MPSEFACATNFHTLPAKIPSNAELSYQDVCIIDLLYGPAKSSEPSRSTLRSSLRRNSSMVLRRIGSGKREARKLVIDYFNALVDAPNRGPFEARIAEQAIKFALIYHTFAQIKIERRSQGTYGVEDFDEELPPLDRWAMEAGLGISQWFSRCQEEFLSKKRLGDRENVYHRFHQKFSKHPFFTTRELYSAGLDVNTAEEARQYFEDWESRGLIEQLKTEEKGGPGRKKLPHYRFTIMLRGKFA